MHDATLCFITHNNKVLLGLKKRGFGKDLWNAFGGKVKDETIEEAAIREMEEECGIKVNKLEKVASLSFYFTNAPEGKNWDQIVHVFIAKDWTGFPEESEEMKPKWFDIDKIPLDKMWDDDRIWLPEVLKGKKIKATFTFGLDNNSIQDYKMEEI